MGDCTALFNHRFSRHRAKRKSLETPRVTRIVLEGLRGEDSIAEFCRCEEIVQNLYHLLETGEKRLAGDTARAAVAACAA